MTDVATAEEAAHPPADGSDATTAARQSWLRRSWPVLVALVVSLVCHGLLARGAAGPVWMDDEVGYLANAAFMAGVDQPPFASLGYWGGWSLSLVPLYLVLDDAGSVYAAAVATSGLLGALVVLPAYVLARQLTSSRAVAVAAAVVVTNVPDRTVMSNYALSENALVLATFVAAALAYAGTRAGRSVVATGGSRGHGSRVASRRAAVLHVGAAVACVAAFAVHARGASLVGAAVLLGLGHLLHAGRRVLGATVVVVAVVGAVVVYLLNSALVSAVYSGAAGQREGRLLDTLAGLDPTSLALAASGQGWYQVAAWAGLSLAGVVVVAGATWSDLRTRGVRFAADGWLLAAVTAGTLLSVVATSAPISRGTDRMDFYFYGRYVTHLAAVLALVGLVWLLDRAARRHVAVLAVVVVALSAVFMLWGTTYGNPTRAFATLNVPAATPWPWPQFTAVETYPVGWMSVAALVLLLVVLLLRRWPVAAAVVVVALALIAGQTAQRLTLDRFDGPVQAAAAPLRPTLDLLGHDAVLLVGTTPFLRNSYQFWLWPEPVRSVARGEELTNGPREVVIGNPEDPRLTDGSWRTVVCDRTAESCLLVAPGPFQEELDAAGMLAQEPGEPLPEGALRAAVEVVDVVQDPVAGDRLQLLVSHEGGQAPWPALGSQEGADGVVRLLATWSGGSSLVDLPRSLVPGDRAEVVVPLPGLPDDVGAVQVSLFVEGDPAATFDGGRVDVQVP